MSDKQQLPPLPKDAYDGHKEEALIHRDDPLPKTCAHKNVQIISSTEIRCSCGAGWQGQGVLEIHKLLTTSSK